MAVPEIILEIFRGEDRTFEFTVTPVEDITVWTIQIFIGFVIPVTKAAVVTDGPAGEYTVTLDRDETENEQPGEFDYDIWRTDITLEHVLAKGKIVVKEVQRT